MSRHNRPQVPAAVSPDVLGAAAEMAHRDARAVVAEAAKTGLFNSLPSTLQAVTDGWAVVFNVEWLPEHRLNSIPPNRVRLSLRSMTRPL